MRDLKKPIGAAGWETKIVEKLPENLKGSLPTVEELDAELSREANGADFLMTWNCRHIANAEMRAKIGAVCREAGYEPPVICTPEELMGD